MNLWLRVVADSTERQLTQGPGGDYQPTWSPDGSRIVFFSARAGSLVTAWEVDFVRPRGSAGRGSVGNRRDEMI